VTFAQRVRSVQLATDSLLCIGLDPDLNKLPRSLRSGRDPAATFCRIIIQATADLVCAYKINLAFFEAQGSAGWKSIERILTHIPEGVLCIGDAKRGDIGNSSAQYAEALFVRLGFDAVTVNPYMGRDSVEPFLAHRSKGTFLLALTSNRGASDFQYLKSDGQPLYQHVVARANTWNRQNNCGLVVGATRASDLGRIRRLARSMPILIPGIGAQGGDLRNSVRYGCTTRGDLALINVGRTILYASSRADFAVAARTSAEETRTSINRYRREFFHTS